MKPFRRQALLKATYQEVRGLFTDLPDSVLLTNVTIDPTREIIKFIFTDFEEGDTFCRNLGEAQEIPEKNFLTELLKNSTKLIRGIQTYES